MPSLDDYLNAATNVATQRTSANFSPLGGMTTLKDLTGASLTSPSSQVSAGFYASAYLTSSDQVIVTFGATDPNITTAYGLATISVDRAIANNQLPAENEAFVNSFMQNVESVAQENGISSSSIFVDGFSLGGVYAQYAAQQHPELGGGASFGSPGLPGYSGTISSGGNFTNYLNYGDPVANASSDSPAGVAAGFGNQNHYGNDVWRGNPSDQQRLTNAQNTVNNAPVYDPVTGDSPQSDAELALLGIEVTQATLHNLNYYGQLFGSVSLNSSTEGAIVTTASDGSESVIVTGIGVNLNIGDIGSPNYVVDAASGNIIAISYVSGTNVVASLQFDNTSGQSLGTVGETINPDGTETFTANDGTVVTAPSGSTDHFNYNGDGVWALNGLNPDFGSSGLNYQIEFNTESSALASPMTIEEELGTGSAPVQVYLDPGSSTVITEGLTSDHSIGYIEATTTYPGGFVQTTIAGHGDNPTIDYGYLTLEDGVQAIITGTENFVVAGNGCSITLNGVGNRVVSGDNDMLFVYGGGATIDVGGGNTIFLAGTNGVADSVSELGPSGQGGNGQLTSIILDAGVQATTYISGGNIQVGDGSILTVYGDGNQFSLGAAESLTLWGNNANIQAGDSASVSLYGAGNQVVLGASGSVLISGTVDNPDIVTGQNASVNVDVGAAAIVHGDDSIVAASYGGSVELDGTRENITADEATITLDSQNASATITGGINQIIAADGSAITLAGTSNAVDLANGTVTLSGNGSVATIIGNNDGITLNGSNQELTAGNSSIVTLDNLSNEIIVASGSNVTLGNNLNNVEIVLSNGSTLNEGSNSTGLDVRTVDNTNTINWDQSSLSYLNGLYLDWSLPDPFDPSDPANSSKATTASSVVVSADAAGVNQMMATASFDAPSLAAATALPASQGTAVSTELAASFHPH